MPRRPNDRFGVDPKQRARLVGGQRELRYAPAFGARLAFGPLRFFLPQTMHYFLRRWLGSDTFSQLL